MNVKSTSPFSGGCSQRFISRRQVAGRICAAAILIGALTACTSTAVVHEPYRATAVFSGRYKTTTDVDAKPKGPEYAQLFQAGDDLQGAVERDGWAVEVAFVIDERGNPQEVQCIRADNEAQAREAERSVARWRFVPAIKDGAPVPYAYSINLGSKRQDAGAGNNVVSKPIPYAENGFTRM